MTEDITLELSAVVDYVASCYLLLKQYARAEETYRKTLAFVEHHPSLDKARRAELTAGTYHQLGSVAEEQREWAQATHYYQQALAIYIEYQDRYEQARTYHQLGRLAEEQREWAQQGVARGLCPLARRKFSRDGP